MASGCTLLSSALALACVGALASCSPPAEREPRSAPRMVLPTSPMRALDSSETRLAVALHGRPALVNLWATWCDACRDELATLNKVDTWAKERGALVVGVAVGEPTERVSSFAAQSHLSYMVLVDEEFHFADAIGEKRVPTTLVVDRDGRVVYAGGAVDRKALDAFAKVLGAGAHAENASAGR